MDIDCLPDGTSDAKYVSGRRIVPAVMLGLLIMLAGCGELSRSVTQTARGSVTGGPPLPISPTEVASRPLFQLLVRTEHGKALLILGNIEGTREIWYGPRGSAVFLEYGRVVKTANLETNLEQTRVTDGNPFAKGLNHVDGTLAFDSVDDWSPGYRYGNAVHSTLIRGDVETIEILGKPHSLLRVDEKRGVAAGWSATNHYWVDPDTGFIWKSEQTVAPGLTLTLVQLKPRLQGGP